MRRKKKIKNRNPFKNKKAQKQKKNHNKLNMPNPITKKMIAKKGKKRK